MEDKRVTEGGLAQRIYDRTDGVTEAAVARLVRALRRHGLATAVLEDRARGLLTWAARRDRLEVFARISPAALEPPPPAPPLMLLTGQAGPVAGVVEISPEDLDALLDQPLSSGVRLRHANRAQLLAHVERLERQAATMQRHARLLRAVLACLTSDDETVETALARRRAA